MSSLRMPCVFPLWNTRLHLFGNGDDNEPPKEKTVHLITPAFARTLTKTSLSLSPIATNGGPPSITPMVHPRLAARTPRPTTNPSVLVLTVVLNSAKFFVLHETRRAFDSHSNLRGLSSSPIRMQPQLQATHPSHKSNSIPHLRPHEGVILKNLFYRLIAFVRLALFVLFLIPLFSMRSVNLVLTSNPQVSCVPQDSPRKS